MNLLTMEHITKAYTDRVLLNDVAFSINENEKIGVIGINGMGKSTLLKVTAGIEPYDEGKISMGKQVKISYLPQLFRNICVVCLSETEKSCVGFAS